MPLVGIKMEPEREEEKSWTKSKKTKDALASKGFSLAALAILAWASGGDAERYAQFVKTSWPILAIIAAPDLANIIVRGFIDRTMAAKS